MHHAHEYSGNNSIYLSILTIKLEAVQLQEKKMNIKDSVVHNRSK